MKKTIFTGSGTAIITPMNPDGSVNYDCFGELIEFQIENGTDALIVCGTTGEASTLTDDEHRECIRFATEKTAKRIPVIAGTGSNDTAYARELSKTAEQAGADAVLLVSPYYNKTSQKGLVAHFKSIADCINIPVILYNIPSRTNINISIETFKELQKHPNIVAVKESGGNIGSFEQLLLESELDVYAGDDSMTIPVMALGAKGVISVMANIMPKEMHELCRLCLENNVLEAGRKLLTYGPLTDALFIDVNPMPVKAALNLMGKNAGKCRLPLVDIDDVHLEKLRGELKKFKLCD